MSQLKLWLDVHYDSTLKMKRSDCVDLLAVNLQHNYYYYYYLLSLLFIIIIIIIIIIILELR